jgi:hypothetical protein
MKSINKRQLDTLGSTKTNPYDSRLKDYIVKRSLMRPLRFPLTAKHINKNIRFKSSQNYHTRGDPLNQEDNVMKRTIESEKEPDIHSKMSNMQTIN